MSSYDNLLLVMIGSSIFTVGVLALCAHFSSAVLRERILLWFGLFAAPYGLALVCRCILIPQWDGSAERIIFVLGRVIGFAASIPALLLFQEFYGQGWRLSSKWLLWIYAFLLLGVFFLMVTHERVRTIPSPGIALVILVPLALLIDRLAGYRAPPIKGRLVIFSGLLIFFLTFSYDHLSAFRRIHEEKKASASGLTFSYDHLSALRATGRHVSTEPIGFLALMACLGYVVSKRVAANEAEWISLTDEMRAARKIQDAILPSSMPTVSPWAVAARYSPMSGVAGDFYGFPRVLPNSLGIILADVMGHGVAAALIASMVKVAVFNGTEHGQSPAKIVEVLNRTLCKEAPGQLASAVYVELQEGNLARYTAGGQPPPLLWRRGEQRLDPLDSAGLLLGIRPGEPYDDNALHFAKGDRLLIYSDGLTEAENGKGESFGDAVLPEFFVRKQNLSAETFAEALLQSVLAWSVVDSRPGQADDITFVIVDL
jgi:sigma-B regulation protein RsbU (phosphoserine phosphatase)